MHAMFKGGPTDVNSSYIQSGLHATLGAGRREKTVAHNRWVSRACPYVRPHPDPVHYGQCIFDEHGDARLATRPVVGPH